MGLRDLWFWTREAKRRGLQRLLHLYAASVLPWMKPEEGRAEFDRVRWELKSMDLEGQAEEAERRYEAKVKAGKHKNRKKKVRKVKEAGNG